MNLTGTLLVALVYNKKMKPILREITPRQVSWGNFSRVSFATIPLDNQGAMHMTSWCFFTMKSYFFCLKVSNISGLIRKR